MSKISKIKSSNMEEAIMAKVRSSEISMRPRWYFVVGSLLTMLGLVSGSIGAIFLTNLTLFSLRQHGPMGPWRLQIMLESFPMWVPLLAVLGIALGIWMLRKYDFSYKNNFWLVVAGFIISIILAAVIIDYLSLNDTWLRQGPMRRFYLHGDGQRPMFQRQMRQGEGWKLGGPFE